MPYCTVGTEPELRIRKPSPWKLSLIHISKLTSISSEYGVVFDSNTSEYIYCGAIYNSGGRSPLTIGDGFVFTNNYVATSLKLSLIHICSAQADNRTSLEGISFKSSFNSVSCPPNKMCIRDRAYPFFPTSAMLPPGWRAFLLRRASPNIFGRTVPT